MINLAKPAILHRSLVAAISAFNRNPWTSGCLAIVPRSDQPLYDEDGLWTRHGQPFLEDPRFAKAYARGVDAGGFDYQVRWRAHVMLWAARACSALEGAFVECGTGRGFMASAICDFLDWQDRPFYLFDTFRSGTPDDTGCQLETSCPNRYYASDPAVVRENFAQWPGVRLVVGRVPDTLEHERIDQVAFLHIDMNNAPAEEAAIRHFWPRLTLGGVVIFDDYGFEGFEKQRGAADEAGRELGFEVLALPTGQGLVLRGRSA